MTGSSKESLAAPLRAERPWIILRSFAGWRPGDLGADVVAGLTLAAIAIPSQMATARLANLTPQIGLLALIAAAIGFALFGDSRRLSVGADSTIAPIFAGALGVLAATGPEHYAAAAAALSLAVGLILTFAGAFKFGFVADLLSIPVTTGFLIGIAGHILILQAPAVLGVEPNHGPLAQQALSLIARGSAANPWTLTIGLGVLAIMLVGESLSPRFPGALDWPLPRWTGNGCARSRSQRRGDARVDRRRSAPSVAAGDRLGRLSRRRAARRARCARSGGADSGDDAVFSQQRGRPGRQPGFHRRRSGQCLLLVSLGAFPVDASPPSTAVAAEAGCRSQLAALISAAAAVCVLLFASEALAHLPSAALAGVLLFVAIRLVRVGVMVDVWRRSRAEFLLILATALAIVALPIEQGVGVGVLLSVLHGVWTTTRAQAIELERIPGTTIWWPREKDVQGELVSGVRVVALQAPLSFLNAYNFRRGIERFASQDPLPKLIVIEANALVEIDYTGATVLAELIGQLRARGVDVAVARLESVRAQKSLAQVGLFALIGRDHVFRSVQEAIDALGPRIA